jgi:NAD(P)-dependent dehydrogenase (short-subunit alcohol dehydrogenase family)
VTGATGDIGRGLCAALHQRGYFVVATDLRSSASDADAFFEFDLAELPRNAVAQQHFEQTVSEALDGKPLNCLINNAAVQILAKLDDLVDSDIQRTLDVNLFAPIVLCRIFLPKLERARGSVINIGSIHADLTKPGFAAYATSKGAIRTLTRALAVDLGPRVRVNCIQPAAVDTAMLREGFSEQPSGLTTLHSYHPTQRIAEPAEIGYLAVFLASDQARSITGASIDVSNGIAARLHDPA